MIENIIIIIAIAIIAVIAITIAGIGVWYAAYMVADWWEERKSEREPSEAERREAAACFQLKLLIDEISELAAGKRVSRNNTTCHFILACLLKPFGIEVPDGVPLDYEIQEELLSCGKSAKFAQVLAHLADKLDEKGEKDLADILRKMSQLSSDTSTETNTATSKTSIACLVAAMLLLPGVCFSEELPTDASALALDYMIAVKQQDTARWKTLVVPEVASNPGAWMATYAQIQEVSFRQLASTARYTGGELRIDPSVPLTKAQKAAWIKGFIEGVDVPVHSDRTKEDVLDMSARALKYGHYALLVRSMDTQSREMTRVALSRLPDAVKLIEAVEVLLNAQPYSVNQYKEVLVHLLIQGNDGIWGISCREEQINNLLKTLKK